MEAEFLSPAEVKALAGKAEACAQAEALKLLGLPHRLVGRRCLVSRYHVREWLAGRAVAASSEPDMTAVR